MEKTTAFDRFSLEYDMWFDTHKAEYEQELKAIKMLLPGDGEGLEIGAGTGRFLQALGITSGIEPSRAMREIARNRGVKLIDGRAESLPVKNGSYDYALLVTTVCFLDSPAMAFREVHRILKPDGYILIGMIDKNSTLGNQYEKRKSDSKFYKEATFHSVEEIQNELINTGFGNIEYAQAILPGDVSETPEAEVQQGYGNGSFVVIRAQKDG